MVMMGHYICPINMPNDPNLMPIALKKELLLFSSRSRRLQQEPRSPAAVSQHNPSSHNSVLGGRTALWIPLDLKTRYSQLTLVHCLLTQPCPVCPPLSSDIKCCFRAVLVAPCVFVVVWDEVLQSQEVAQQPKLCSTLQWRSCSSWD